MADLGSSFAANWPEYAGAILLILGMIVSFSLQSEIVTYTIIFIAGLMAGRLIYTRKGRQPLFPFFIMLFGFLAGYFIGAVNFNRKIILFLFVAGTIAGYYAHKEGIIHGF